MSLEIIIQEIKIFGKLLQPKVSQGQQINQLRRFRISFGDKTYISQNHGYFISQNQLYFEDSFSFYYDHHSIMLQAEIFKQHEIFNNSDLEQILFAEIDLSDITNMVDQRIEANLMNMKNQAIGKITMIIEVFKQGPRFIEKVTSKILFDTVKEQKQKQIQVTSAGKNIKNLMVNNSLTNSLMTVNYLEIKPENEDSEIFNRESFIMIRYGLQIKAFSKVIKIDSKDNIIWNEYLEFMKNQDVKFQIFFLFYDDLGSIVCKAKGEIKYIVFDETINNHTITLFDKRSNIYGDLLVKFIEKEVEVVNIKNPIDKKLRQAQQEILTAIEAFNKFKFQTQNNNRILSQKLRELELRKLQQEEQKNKPLDEGEKKKKEEHSKFIEFLQKQVIKIDRELKKRQIEQKKDERKHKYIRNSDRTSAKGNSKFNLSLNSSDFKSELRENLIQLQEINEQHIVAEEINEK